MKSAILLVLTAAPLAACMAPRETAPVFYDAPPPRATTLIEGPYVAPPANDVPESRRIAWHEANRPPVVVVERDVVVREVPTVRYVRTYDSCYDRCYEPCWSVPLSIGIGWWGGRWGGRHGRGWNWGVSWRGGRGRR